MFSFLKQPFPCIYEQKSNFASALLIGLFVTIFLLTFKPFGIEESELTYTVVKTAGFGVVSFVVMLFIYFVLPKIFTAFFKEKDYTVANELIVNVGIVLLIGLANSLYANFFIEHSNVAYVLGMIGNTFLVGIFPITFITMIQYNRLLKLNLQDSQNIKLPTNSEQLKEVKKVTLQYFVVPNEQEQVEVNLDHLLYLESEGNYVHLHRYENSGHTKTLHRSTLKSIEDQNSFSNVIRCHRSYIVNLDQVLEVNGNAQGLKLKLKNHDELIPVSRKYIQAVKNYFDTAN